MRIREATSLDLGDVLAVEQAAFGTDNEAELVCDLLDDPSARPLVSLLALSKGRAVGHILFTNARLTQTVSSTAISILAPLAVVPDEQRKGVGGRLIESGLGVLSRSGVQLVFVLGYPDYYQRHGSIPAAPRGFDAPYPIPEEHSDAWMVRALESGVVDCVRGRVRCARAARPELWRE